MTVRIILLLLLLPVAAFAQNSVTDDLRAELAATRSDTGRAILLYKLSYYYRMFKPDSAVTMAAQSLDLSRRQRFTRGEAAALGQLGGAFNELGNFPKALEYYLQQLPLLEARNDPQDLAPAYLSISVVYNSQKDEKAALRYAHRADSIVMRYSLNDQLPYTKLDIGDIYYNAGALDSALKYTTLSLQFAGKEANKLVAGTALNNMGNIFFHQGNWGDALVHYRGARAVLEAEGDLLNLSECYLGLAKTFGKLGIPDSALFCAQRSSYLARENGFLRHALSASAFLGSWYRDAGRLDSAVAYQDLYITLKDSFVNSEKIRQLEGLTIDERLRQEGIALQRAVEEKERGERMQLIAIAVFIPLLLLVTIYASRRAVRPRTVRFMGVVSLLFLFEYITLLLHPVVQHSAHHAPIIEIVLFVGIAALLSPAHHRIEHWLIARLAARHERRQQEALARELAAVAEAPPPVTPMP